MPHINAKDREDERERLPFDREHPKARDRAILYVQTYDHIHNYLHHGITRSFDDTKRGAYSFLRLLPGADDTVSSVDRAVIAMRNAFQLHSFHTIAVMLAYQLNPAVIPGGGVDSLS
jgi:hypothetical protein